MNSRVNLWAEIWIWLDKHLLCYVETKVAFDLSEGEFWYHNTQLGDLDLSIFNDSVELREGTLELRKLNGPLVGRRISFKFGNYDTRTSFILEENFEGKGRLVLEIMASSNLAGIKDGKANQEV